MPSLTKWSLGIASETGQPIIIFPQGTEVPARRHFVVTTLIDEQTNICLDIRLGESEMACENFALSNLKLDYIDIVPKGVPRVKLTFCAYEHSVFKLWVCYKEGEEEREILITPTAGLTEKEIGDLQSAVNRLIKEIDPQQIEDLDLGTIALPPAI